MARFVVFWAALTLGPLLLAASLAMSGDAHSLPMLQQAATQADELGAKRPGCRASGLDGVELVET